MMCIRKKLHVLGFMAAAIMVTPLTPDAAFAQTVNPTSGKSTSAVPADALLSHNGGRAIWPMDNGAGYWFSERQPDGAWSTPRNFEMRGLVRDPVFSPDGEKLAFENRRGGYPTGRWNERSYEWSFIGVYDFAKGTISYLDPAFARDSDPRWQGADSIAYVRRVDGLADASLTAKVGVATPPPSAEKTVLARMLAAAALYQPVASADGAAFAFAAREGGTRSVYFAKAGAKARAVAVYPGDDGQDLSHLALSPDGTLLAYVRGSTLNSKGEVSNPRLFPTPPRREIWLVNTLSGAPPRLLGQGDAPVFSPDGRQLLWQTAKAVMTAPLTGKGETLSIGKPDILVMGTATNLRFSPDGERIVFQRVFDTAVSTRVVANRASRIDIVHLKSRKIVGIARPISANDTDPSWSPDSREIAFVRTFRDAPGRTPFETSEPWTILAADADSGAVRQVWRADQGKGSVFFGLAPDPTGNTPGAEQLLWSADNQIGFVWEKDGWRHLYAVPAAGGTARLLTPGDGEVEKAALSLDRTTILYAHNIGDIPGRHVSTVPFSGGRPNQLADSATNQWSPTALAGGAVAFIDSGWARPQTVKYRSASGAIMEAGPSAAPDFPAQRFVKPIAVAFPATDGKIAFGQLFVPKRATGCGIVFIHGGKERQMLLSFHYIDVYSYFYAMNQYLASRGCAVLSLEYRGSLMHGESYRNIPGYGATGRVTEYADFVGAANYLRARKELGVKKVGVYGISQGGFSTAISLGRNSDIFQVGFDMSGVHDYPGSAPEAALAAYVDRWASPVMIASGDDDRAVDHGQSMMLYSELMRRNPKFEVAARVLINETHDLYQSMENFTNLCWDGSEFMLKYLQE